MSLLRFLGTLAVIALKIAIIGAAFVLMLIATFSGIKWKH